MYIWCVIMAAVKLVAAIKYTMDHKELIYGWFAAKTLAAAPPPPPPPPLVTLLIEFQVDCQSGRSPGQWINLTDIVEVWRTMPRLH